MTEKPRYRIHAGSSNTDSNKHFAIDSYQNFAAQLGIGSQNLTSAGTYGFLPISRNHTRLEFMYRGSWLVRQVVDAVADDMTRAGIHIDSDDPPDRLDELTKYLQEFEVWQRINATIKWARLYGGALAVILVDGQSASTPLRVDSISKGQFKGLLVLDRWMVNPHLEAFVSELGPDFGRPIYYDIVTSRGMAAQRIHYTRCIRVDGVELPYWQRMAENEWGLSVIEPMFDRLLAFDSCSAGAAQLVYKAHLRHLYIERLREIVSTGGAIKDGLMKQVEMMRVMQSNEGISLFDSTDRFETTTYNFGGVSDLITQFAQQLSGASQIPLTRLFGQAPAGLNATGESDMRNYYDSINAQQEARLRRPMRLLIEVAYRSKFGDPLPAGFSFGFNPLWQMTAGEKLASAAGITGAISGAFTDGTISIEVALKELRAQSRVTGVFTNITDEDISAAGANENMLEAARAALAGTSAGPGAPGAPASPPGGLGPATGAFGEASGDPLESFRSITASPEALSHFKGPEEPDPLASFKTAAGEGRNEEAIEYFGKLPTGLQGSALEWFTAFNGSGLPRNLNGSGVGPSANGHSSLGDPSTSNEGRHAALRAIVEGRADETSPSWTEAPDGTVLKDREDLRQAFARDPNGKPSQVRR